jgi:hypothetical protein
MFFVPFSVVEEDRVLSRGVDDMDGNVDPSA